MLDRIIREHSYAMSEKVAPRPSSEPEEVLDYDFVRVRMPNRKALALLRRQEEADRPERERLDRVKAEKAEREEAETQDRAAAVDPSSDWRSIAMRRRLTASEAVVKMGLSRVDATNLLIMNSTPDSAIQRKEGVAAELFSRYGSELSGHSVFPVFTGVRLWIDGRWSRVIGMSLEHCTLYVSSKSEVHIGWDVVLRCFDAGASGADVVNCDSELLEDVRFKFNDIWPMEWGFPFVPGACFSMEDRRGVILKVTKNIVWFLPASQRKSVRYYWGGFLKAQREQRDQCESNKSQQSGFHRGI
jgi:hypothetical protein